MGGFYAVETHVKFADLIYVHIAESRCCLMEFLTSRRRLMHQRYEGDLLRGLDISIETLLEM